MKLFTCVCGQGLFFDNSSCIACGRLVGFDPVAFEMVPYSATTDPNLIHANGGLFRLCTNGAQYGVCNWLIPSQSEQHRCTACQLNRTIPNLSNPANSGRWNRLELAKRRLVYTLLQLQLPLISGHQDSATGLLFDLVEDGRTDPARSADAEIRTGYMNGVITINVQEADDVAREAAKIALNESYRTLLGHMRHESGHYYMSLIHRMDGPLERIRALFGDERTDYASALSRYYDQGAAANWRSRYISAYASAHPAEDWAETWGHYLHIVDVLQTAEAHGVIASGSGELAFTQRLKLWRKLSVTLNELNRSVGLGDAYPFVVNDPVSEKLACVDQAVAWLPSTV